MSTFTGEKIMDTATEPTIVCQYCGDEMVAGHITMNAAPAHLQCALEAGDVEQHETISLEDPSVKLVALEDLVTDDSGEITPMVEPFEGINCLAKVACGFPSCDCTEIAEKKLALHQEEDGRHVPMVDPHAEEIAQLEEDEATIDETITALEDAGHDVSLIRGTQDKDPGGRAFPIMAIEDVTEFDATGTFKLGVMPDEPTAEELVELEFKLIAAGVELANKRGLLIEFIWSALQTSRAHSTDVGDSIEYAISEWDM